MFDIVELKSFVIFLVAPPPHGRILRDYLAIFINLGLNWPKSSQLIKFVLPQTRWTQFLKSNFGRTPWELLGP